MDYNFIYNELKNKNISELNSEQISDMKDFIVDLVDANSNTFDRITQRILSYVPDTLDKRTSSVIYNAIAPVAGELAQAYIEIQIYKDQTYLMTATGDDLDRKGEEYGIERGKATKAERLGKFIDTNDNMVNMPIGSRFTVPESNNTITYYVKEYQSTGIPVLVCEQYGTKGNKYIGELLPLFNVDNLKIAEIGTTIQPAQDKELDETYRQKIIDRLKEKGFGGNIQDYKNYVLKNITGASEPKVYPTWNGGGTVKISVLDSQFNPISNEFISLIKEELDPEAYTGQGIGIAPIGHKVTVDTPQAVEVNIEATVSLEGVTSGQILSTAKENIEKYFYNTRKTWVDYETIRIFKSQIIANILEIKGVQNVTDVFLNNEQNDLSFTSNAEKQYVPVLGSVVLNEQ